MELTIFRRATLSNGDTVVAAKDSYGEKWIFWCDEYGVIETSGQSYLTDFDDYRYTHGGALYREAIEKLQ